jgi:hypothetical protein
MSRYHTIGITVLNASNKPYVIATTGELIDPPNVFEIDKEIEDNYRIIGPVGIDGVKTSKDALNLGRELLEDALGITQADRLTEDLQAVAKRASDYKEGGTEERIIFGAPEIKAVVMAILDSAAFGYAKGHLMLGHKKGKVEI